VNVRRFASKPEYVLFHDNADQRVIVPVEFKSAKEADKFIRNYEYTGEIKVFEADIYGSDKEGFIKWARIRESDIIPAKSGSRLFRLLHDKFVGKKASAKQAAQFIDPFPGLTLDRPLSPREITRAIRQAIAAEHEAVHFYEAVADSTDNLQVQKIMQNVANEEKVHVGEFQRLLEILDEDEAEFIEEGVDEINDELEISKELFKMAKELISFTRNI